MKTRASNGGEHAFLAVRLGAQRPSDARSQGQLRSAGLLRDTTELHRALAASQQRLGAALGQIDTLRRQDSALRREVDRLAEAVLQARQFAHHDPLTGLPNRVLLLDRFKQAVARADRQHKQVVLLFLDLDGFKSINDALGHAWGDRILQQVAARLASCIRASDTACRYGGDEFVVLLPEFEGQESAVAAAEKIRAQLATAYVVDGTAIEVTTSIGMAIYPVDGHEYDELIQAADLAMYRSKGRRLRHASLNLHLASTRTTRSANMKPGTPKQTGSEKKFDRAKEEAFSNEGAPPPGQVSSLGDDAEVESSNDEPDVKTSGEGAPKSRASLFGLTRSRGL